MSGKLTQPQVDHYFHWLRHGNHFGMYRDEYDEKSNELLDELFKLLEQIKPIAENGARTLWLRAERGPIEDYGNAKDEIENGNFDSEEEFIASWREWFPEEIKWYHFAAVEIKEEQYRAITLCHDFVVVQDKQRKPSGFPNDISEFVQWMIDETQKCIEMLRNGTYNEFVQMNLPPQHRFGTISRKDFWNVWPEHRREFFKNISPQDVNEFIEKVSSQNADYRMIQGRLLSMTANDFYQFCAMGYAENKYKGCERTPKEQYYLHADGRDEGLRDIDPDDPEAFVSWLDDNKRFGGHPWEVCRGGNSTHVAMHVMHDDLGFYLYLAGDSWTRTIETVKFYLALTRAGIPVFLAEAKTLADRLLEREIIGIVPEGMMPAYCENYFPNTHIIDFMNLPFEDREQFLPYCNWIEEKPITLIHD